MRQVQIYIELERGTGNYTELELFQDETISINSSVQNVQDISKVFTDFSQGFTVPASKTNNSIFRHFYENSVNTDLSKVDNRLSRNAYIEINRIPFRSGLIELEKSNLKNNIPESYSITFYGNITTLKDLIGDTMLSDLDFSSVSNPYTYADVRDRVFDYVSDYDVRYPLITSDRVWSYGDSTSTDVSINGGAINYTELFPALKVSKIFDLIESKFGVTFNGIFLGDKRFTNLFLWCKNAQSKSGILQNELIDFISKSGDTSIYSLDLSTDTIKIRGNNLFTGIRRLQLNLGVVYVSDVTIPYTIEIYDKGILQNTITRTGNASFNVWQEWITATSERDITLRVRADQTIDVQFALDYKLYAYSGSNLVVVESESADANLTSVTNSIDLSMVMPEMKVSDFFTGVLKQFNLTVTPTSTTTFDIEPLDWWYQKGGVIDITRHVDIDSIDINKVPLYKRLSFEYETSESFTSKEFLSTNRREYGNLTDSFEYKGDEFTIKVPFENIKFEKFSGQDMTVAYTLKEKDYTTYVPKPILLYMYEKRTTGATGFKMTDGIGNYNTSTTFMPFGQDVFYNGLVYSLNFGQETSPLIEQEIPNSLYLTYYKSYIENMFSYKNRLVNVKAVFPISILTNLKLNDRLIIRDKRYTINNLKSNITTGEVELELLHDLREIGNSNPPILDNGAGSIDIPVLLLNGATQTAVSTSTLGVTFSGVTFTSDDYVTVTYPANPTAEFEIITEAGDNVITSDNFNLIDEESNYLSLIHISEPTRPY